MRFRPDTDMTPEIIRAAGPGSAILGEQKGKSGASVLELNEARVVCRRCGSPAVAIFDDTDEKFGAELPGFECEAGDCPEGKDGHGVAIRGAR